MREKRVIQGVLMTPLRQIADDRGRVMHMMRRDDPHFEEFGEIYFSTVNPGFIKGWHCHAEMTLNYAVVAGTVQLALYDDRDASPTRGELVEVVSNEANYVLIRVPPGVWNGFKGLGTTLSIVANCATHPHDPAEIIRKSPDWDHIPYDWSAGPA